MWCLQRMCVPTAPINQLPHHHLPYPQLRNQSLKAIKAKSSLLYQLSSESLFSILHGERQTDHNHPSKLVKNYGIAFLLSPLNPSFLHSYNWKIIKLLLVKALLFPNLGPLCWGFYFYWSNLNHLPTPLPAVALLPFAFCKISTFIFQIFIFHIFLNQRLLFPNPPPVFGLVAPCLRRPHDRAAISPVVSTSTPLYHTVTIPHSHLPHSHTYHRHDNTCAPTTQSQYHTHNP